MLNDKKDYNDFDEDIESIDDGDISNFTTQIEKSFNDLKSSISTMTEDLKKKLDSIEINKETVTSCIDDFSKTVDEMVKNANETFEKFKNDPKTVETLNNVKNTYEKVTTTIADKANELYAKARENENFKTMSDTTVSKITEFKELFAEKYQEFIHNPNVRKTVMGAVNTFKDAYNKTYSSIEKALEENSKDKKED